MMTTYVFKRSIRKIGVIKYVKSVTCHPHLRPNREHINTLKCLLQTSVSTRVVPKVMSNNFL